MELEKPLPSDCCGNGCSPCVFDIYEQCLRSGQTGKNYCNEASLRTDLLSKTRFKPFRLIEKTQITGDVFRFKFQAVENILKGPSKKEEIIGVLSYNIGQYLFLRCYIKSSRDNIENKKESINAINYKPEAKTEIQCTAKLESEKNPMIIRAYTPITIATLEKNCCFTIFAKLYKNGIGSDYLNKTAVNDILYWRGPYGSFQYNPNSFSNVLMLCIGSGLAPMIGIINTILNNESDETVIHLMYGVKNLNHIILRSDLSKMTQYWNFTLEYYFSQKLEYNNNQVKFGELIRNGKIDKIVLDKYIKGKEFGKLLVLICGTESFVSDMKSHISGINIKLHIF